MRSLPALLLTIAMLAPAAGQAREAGGAAAHAPGLVAVDAYTLRPAESFLSSRPALNPDGTINVVVEIPTGTTAKWEVSKPSGDLVWELEEGEPRVVHYLGYPGNYGMLPRTLLAKEAGGDGDPLDVIVLGPAVARGAVVEARVLGVLQLLDGGEQDDKIVAVLEGDPLAEAGSIEELDAKFPGVSAIVETWFASYKGPGVLESRGFAGRDAAQQVIESAAAAFRQ
jgi:inorganic pyrophosphatase